MNARSHREEREGRIHKGSGEGIHEDYTDDDDSMMITRQKRRDFFPR